MTKSKMLTYVLWDKLMKFHDYLFIPKQCDSRKPPFEKCKVPDLILYYFISFFKFHTTITRVLAGGCTDLVGPQRSHCSGRRMNISLGRASMNSPLIQRGIRCVRGVLKPAAGKTILKLGVRPKREGVMFRACCKTHESWPILLFRLHLVGRKPVNISFPICLNFNPLLPVLFFQICRVTKVSLFTFDEPFFRFTGGRTARRWRILCRRQSEKSCIESKQTYQNLMHRLKGDFWELRE